MSEPDWEARLVTRIKNLQRVFPEAEGLHALVRALVNVEIEAAYQRGLMAGRSQAGYTTRRKKKEDHALLVRQALPLPRPLKPRGRDEPPPLPQADHPGGPGGRLRREWGATLEVIKRCLTTLKEH
ncbi:hypothetical protein [Streptomyces sp. TRM68367]|uniref:hypothetical protein n=1 Tax=Streptomyces sp. TRM68367 TaxID=2758415 RepID=UPI00165B0A7E|nr:hypothetical protein [Streptomyces sp. TRM68367]MBC9726609.1 hypothetical protein [Streptomyces sp. TRM68367]